jgi:hypothetical protein
MKMMKINVLGGSVSLVATYQVMQQLRYEERGQRSD